MTMQQFSDDRRLWLYGGAPGEDHALHLRPYAGADLTEEEQRFNNRFSEIRSAMNQFCALKNTNWCLNAYKLGSKPNKVSSQCSLKWLSY